MELLNAIYFGSFFSFFSFLMGCIHYYYYTRWIVMHMMLIVIVCVLHIHSVFAYAKFTYHYLIFVILFGYIMLSYNELQKFISTSCHAKFTTISLDFQVPKNLSINKFKLWILKLFKVNNSSRYN